MLVEGIDNNVHILGASDVHVIDIKDMLLLKVFCKGILIRQRLDKVIGVQLGDQYFDGYRVYNYPIPLLPRPLVIRSSQSFKALMKLLRIANYTYYKGVFSGLIHPPTNYCKEQARITIYLNDLMSLFIDSEYYLKIYNNGWVQIDVGDTRLDLGKFDGMQYSKLRGCVHMGKIQERDIQMNEPISALQVLAGYSYLDSSHTATIYPLSLDLDEKVNTIQVINDGLDGFIVNNKKIYDTKYSSILSYYANKGLLKMPEELVIQDTMNTLAYGWVSNVNNYTSISYNEDFPCVKKGTHFYHTELGYIKTTNEYYNRLFGFSNEKDVHTVFDLITKTIRPVVTDDNIDYYHYLPQALCLDKIIQIHNRVVVMLYYYHKGAIYSMPSFLCNMLDCINGEYVLGTACGTVAFSKRLFEQQKIPSADYITKLF